MPKYKIVLSIIIITSLVILSACSTGETAEPPLDLPQAETPDSPKAVDEPGAASGEVVIMVDYESISGWASNQFAVWIEDTNGNLLKTLYATRWTANGGWQTRPESIPLWAARSGLADMPQFEVDAVAGATPRTGSQSYTWDLSGADGSALLPGEYKFFVEGTLRWNNHVVYSGIISVGNEPVTVAADAEFIFETSANGEALSADSPEISMIGAVTANYFPAAGN